MPTRLLPQFSLRFSPADIPRLVAEYWAAGRPEEKVGETHIETVIAPAMVTGCALATENERLRIDVLTL